jgi:hypothetical protein
MSGGVEGLWGATPLSPIQSFRSPEASCFWYKTPIFVQFLMYAKSWFLRLQVFLHRELLILRLRARSSFLLLKQPRWKPTKADSAVTVEMIIPFPAQGRVSAKKQDYYLRNLRKLITTYLPQQTFSKYTATIYCDGENLEVRSLIEKLSDNRFRFKSTDGKESGWGACADAVGHLGVRSRFYRSHELRQPAFPRVS